MPTDLSPTVCGEIVTDSGCFGVPSSMPLRTLLNRWDRNSTPYHVVINDEGMIDGIVDLRQVQKLLATTNLVERVRWESVAVGTIAETVFAVPNGGQQHSVSSDSRHAVQGVPIRDSQGRVAIVVDGETYVSWSRISAAMRQNHLDAVTHLPPRFAFNRRLREEMDRAARSRQSLAVLLVDLDNFKHVNDRFGHRAGDEILRAVAKCLCDGVRSYDFVARFGGDEFIIICYDCGPDDISLPILRLQRAVAGLPPIAMDAATPISLSIGAAVLSAVDEDCPPEVIIEQADTCLYQSKRSGRSTAFTVELDPFGIPTSATYEVTKR